MNYCQTFYTLVTGAVTALVEVWNTMTRFVQACSAQPCTWWCLCCNKWLCWIVVVLVSIVFLVLVVIIVILAVLLVPVCWVVCSVIAVVTSIGPQDDTADHNALPHCFSADAPAPAPAPPPSPSIVIDKPADNSSFPNGDTVPIGFSASVTAADGSTPANPDVRWEIYFGPNSPAIPLGNGLQISATLPHKQSDIDAGVTTPHVVRATVVEGQTSAFATVNVSVGVSIG